MPKNKRKIHHKPSALLYTRKKKSSRLSLYLAGLLGVAVVCAAFILDFNVSDNSEPGLEQREAENAARHEYREPGQDEVQSSANPDQEELPVAEAPREPELVRMTGSVRSGDTPSTLLEGHLGLAEIYALCDESRDVYPLERLRAGQPWTMVYFDNALVGLEYEIDANERLVVAMTENGYEFRREAIPFDLETKLVAGSIESSLFGAVLNLGEKEDLAVRLAEVFAYDVDFVRDLRVGDTFKVIVEKKSREGEFYAYKDLLAAKFTNQGETYYAYRYTNAKGESAYYDQNGKPLRKAFLKSPLPFTRISSGYSMNRMHPILGYRRPHQGIDYAAPTGTPIFTVADGTIAEVSSNKSQGKFVRVKHSNGYETIYNHMSKYAKASKKGSKVKQGAVIGYVGSTGYSTGPHLDFRMRHNGQLINPLKLKAMPADPIASKEMPQFQASIAQYKSQLEDGAIKTAALPVPPAAQP